MFAALESALSLALAWENLVGVVAGVVLGVSFGHFPV